MVPSFSSKGFGDYQPEEATGVKRNTGKGKRQKPGSRSEPLVFSAASAHLEGTWDFIDDALLVSSYDMHFGKLDRPLRFLKGKGLVFIDSGGYELAPEYDVAEPKTFDYKPLDGYGEDQYRCVLDTLPTSLPCIIANFDWGTRLLPLEEQVGAARRLFSKYPKFLHSFLIKPGAGKGRRAKPLTELDIEGTIRPWLPSMRQFHVIGVTEKELGGSLVKRLVAMATLRRAMDECGLNDTPIHLWGGMDPLLSPLYFAAGASIFDGVSWLRYAFHDGMAVSLESGPVLRGELREKGKLASKLTVATNLGMLQSLETDMKRFVDEKGDFRVFRSQAEILAASYAAFASALKSGRADTKEVR
jgi:hypothetical protein